MSVRLDHGEDDPGEMHEINVTPFIDVILVLLIIFMIAAPLVTVDIAVELPTSAAEPRARPDKPVRLTLRRDLSLALDEAPVTREQLTRSLLEAIGGDKTQRIYLSADKLVSYGNVMAVMNLLQAGGFNKVALVGIESEPPR